MITLIERVQELMDAKDWDVEQVAKVAGVSASAVYQWLGKGNKTIHSIGKIEAATRLERASGFNALWLAKGHGPKMAKDAASAPMDLAAAVSLIASQLERFPEAQRDSIGERFLTLAKAPDSAKTKAALLAALQGVSLGEEFLSTGTSSR